MAYDASNNQNDQQVTSSTPLSGGSQQPTPQTQPSEQPQAPSQPATIQAGMSSTEAGQQQQPSSSKKPASSGMFTNIQKYVEKNKPQAQKMSQAVTGNVGSQASAIAEQAKQKEADMKAKLDTNQKMLDQQKGWAASKTEEASGLKYDPSTGQWSQAPTQEPPPPPNQPSVPTPQTTPQGTQPPADQPTFGQGLEGDEAEAKFQELLSGPQGVSEVGALNIGEQQQKARALQQLAGTAETEMGRRGLLQQTFRPEGEYTSGMSGLDQLIVSGDETARESMIQGVQNQADVLQKEINTISSDANKAKMAQDMAIRNFGTDIQNLPAEAEQFIIDEIDKEVAAQKTALENELLAMEKAASEGFDPRFADEEAFYRNIMDQLNPEWSKGGNRAWQDYKSMEYNLLGKEGSFIDALQDRGVGGSKMVYDPNKKNSGFGAQPKGGFVRQDLTPEEAEFLSQNITLGKGQDELINRAFEGLLQNASDYGIDPEAYRKQLQDLRTEGMRKDIYGWSGHQDDKQGDIYSYDAAKFKDITSKLFDQIRAAKENTLDTLVQNKYGMDADAFRSGEFLDRAGVATEDQASRIAALQKLKGSETNQLYTNEDEIGQDSQFMENLRKRLGMS